MGDPTSSCATTGIVLGVIGTRKPLYHSMVEWIHSRGDQYIVDLRRGICYQKCYDPDCQAVGYRSEAMDVPVSLLPSSFFEPGLDDDDEWEDDTEKSFNSVARDEDGSNKHRLRGCHVAEGKGRQDAGHNNSLNETGELKWQDHPRISSCDDDDDDESLLLAAAEEVELGLARSSQVPGLVTVPGRDDGDFDCDDVAMVTAAEEAEMYFHQDMYTQT